jgi:hypothetical protein
MLSLSLDFSTRRRAMARKSVIYGIAAAGLVSAIALVLLVVLPQTTGDSTGSEGMSLQAVLHASPMLDRLRLFSGDTDPNTAKRLSPADRSIDITGKSGDSDSRYVLNGDGSTEDIVLKPDGEHFAVREVFYPRRTTALGRHPMLAQKYSATTDLVTDERQFRYDGTASEHTETSEDGAKHVVGYGADGVKVTHELVVAAHASQWDTPVLQKEMRWRDDASTSLAYSNVYDRAANKRIITDWDENHNPLKVVVPNAYGSNNGTITTAYFPGTSLVRMHSEVESRANIAQYFRMDGTLDHVLEISQGSTLVRLFDKTGKKKLFEQTWSSETKIVDHKGVTTFTINSILEVDAQGNPVRNIRYWSGDLDFEDYNVTIDGVLYGEIDHVYVKGPTGYTLDNVKYWIGKADHKYDREDDHKPAENLLAPPLPADEANQVVNIQEDPDLLLPDVMYGPEGF